MPRVPHFLCLTSCACALTVGGLSPVCADSLLTCRLPPPTSLIVLSLACAHAALRAGMGNGLHRGRSCPACFAAPKERHRIKMMLSEQEFEFPKLFPSLLKTLRPLLSISHANKESDFFRDPDANESVGPGNAATCISGSAYNKRGTTTDTTRYRHKAAKPRSQEEGEAARAPESSPSTSTWAGPEGGAGASLEDAALLAQVCRSEDEMDGEQSAEEALLSCNLASGSCCAPSQRAAPSAEHLSAPAVCAADARWQPAARSTRTGDLGSEDVGVAGEAGTWDVASGMAGFGLGLGIACAAGVCMRLASRS
jgi:hypothetical protein